MFIFATLLMSCIYAVPVAIAFAIRGAAAAKARGQITRAGKIKTSQTSETTAVKFLHSTGFDDVSVTKGNDYLNDLYDEKTKTVKISPDAFGCVDAYSVARALNASSKALACREAPEQIATLAKLDTVSTWLFWGAFCALSFAIMGASLTSACVGYAMILPVWINALVQLKFRKRSDKKIGDFLRNSDSFKPEEIDAILAALDAIHAEP